MRSSHEYLRPGTCRPIAWLHLVRAAAAVVTGLGAGCVDRGLAPERAAIGDVVAVLDPYDSLAAIVSFRATSLDSARVSYWRDGQPQESTPTFRLQDRVWRIPILGLDANTIYNYVV